MSCPATPEPNIWLPCLLVKLLVPGTTSPVRGTARAAPAAPGKPPARSQAVSRGHGTCERQRSATSAAGGNETNRRHVSGG